MLKNIRLLYLIILFLLITNVVTLTYYNYRINSMRSSSSYKRITDASNESFKNCLKNNGIDFMTNETDLMIREVDINPAVARCS